MRLIARIAAIALLAPLSACEETLEVCGACVVPSEGGFSVSGDPRIDGTIESVVEAHRIGTDATAAFDEAVASLADEYGVALENPSAPTSADTTAVVAAIRAQLLEATGVVVAVSLDRPTCWVDTRLALERQITCEEHADCFVTEECGQIQRGSCAGLCAGECVVSVEGVDTNLCAEGSCYQDVEAAGEACTSSCIGVCSSPSGMSCPGRCYGTCDAPCSAFTSAGECAGLCPGLCTGLCESERPMDCGVDGTCRGLCRVPLGTDGSCLGTCMASCADGECAGEDGEGDGECRGHFRPDGCDLPSRCEGVVGCREAGRCIAWVRTSCDPASARVTVELTTLFGGSHPTAIARAAQLERALNAVMAGYGWLSLLVDGADPTGLVDAEDLRETYDPQTRPRPAGDLTLTDLGEFGYAEARESLPLDGLKGRVGMLVREATAGEYTIAAGPLACVRPALEDAWAMMDALLPMACTDEDDDGAYEACEPDRSGGLYRVLDGANALFALGWGADE